MNTDKSLLYCNIIEMKVFLWNIHIEANEN